MSILFILSKISVVIPEVRQHHVHLVGHV